MFIDAHAHLNDLKFDGKIEETVEKYREAGVGLVINSGFDIPSTERAMELSEKYGDMYFTAGVHPDDAKTLDENAKRRLSDMAKHEKCVAIGESGFDFYWNKSTAEEQEKAFDFQMRLSAETGKPLVVHSRDASEKTLLFIRERRDLIKKGFLLHCYSYSAETAEIYKNMGAYFSFGGVITFKNAKKEKVLETVGVERFMTETDCPYLSPEPYRGTRNDPSRIPVILKKAAEIFGKTVKETEKAVEKNVGNFFGLK
ncbi:MAG TPA: hydrolase TatD [Clostridiales bacterium]|nr:hydrolase TatD [Clostridiales bacterium]